MSNDSREDQWAPQPGEDASFDTVEPDDDTIIRPIIGAGAVPVLPDDVPPPPPLPPRPSAPLGQAEFAFAPQDPAVASSTSGAGNSSAPGLPAYDVSHVGAPPPLPPVVQNGADRRGRMPVWGWIAIAAAALALVGGGTFGVITLLQTPGTPQASESADPSEEAVPATPLAEGEYALADTVPFTAAPAWNWDVAEGWETSDATLGDGWTAYSLPTYGGCTMQFYDAPYEVSGDDAADSVTLLDEVVAAAADGATGITETDAKPYWVQADDTALVAMERKSFDLVPAGESGEFRLAVRARVFSETETALAVAYLCPNEAPSNVAQNSVNAATLVTAGLE